MVLDSRQPNRFHPLRTLLRQRLIDRVNAESTVNSTAEIERAVDTAMAGVDASAHPILDWLTGAQFLHLLEIVLALIAQFAAAPAEAVK